MLPKKTLKQGAGSLNLFKTVVAILKSALHQYNNDQGIFVYVFVTPCPLGFVTFCYKLIERFRVTGLFAGQYIIKLHGTITGVIYTIVGSAFLRD